MSKSFYGVAYNSKGKHKARINGTNTSAYTAWHSMIARCYCAKLHARKPTYADCTIDDRWLDFQDFADWYYSHPYRELGYELDKDLLFPNNKIYSPETCCFVPQELNKLLLSHASARGVCPQGVYYHKPTGKYLARMKYNGKSRHLGLFGCPQEAHQAYKKTKEAYVKEKALEWQDQIADNMFQALMNWTLES